MSASVDLTIPYINIHIDVETDLEVRSVAWMCSMCGLITKSKTHKGSMDGMADGVPTKCDCVFGQSYENPEAYITDVRKVQEQWVPLYDIKADVLEEDHG